MNLVVTIPCHDEPDLLATLESLAACEPIFEKRAEVIVLINASETAPAEVKNRNLETFLSAKSWAEKAEKPSLGFSIRLENDLPARHAGVGLARKMAMDEAAQRLEKAENPRGPIVCLDADSRVEPNYLIEIDRFFNENPRCPAASIHFEHPLEGPGFSTDIFEAILFYELHLRVYINGLKKAGLPSAVQTIGSAMAARADAYRAEGGMNRRQAGEDFYFLHKFTPSGRFGLISKTTVLPSPRVSHRVPFGTGRAVGEALEGKAFETYSPAIFVDFELFLRKMRLPEARSLAVEDIEKGLPESVLTFLRAENFAEKLAEISSNTADAASFEKRFFRWMDAFRAMKFVHWARDRFHPNVPTAEAARLFLGEKMEKAEPLELLEAFRKMDKTGAF